MDIRNFVIKAMTEADADRPRSKQTALGPSAVGSCRAQAWLTLKGATPTNQTSKWAAIMGTAIHAHIEAALHRADPFEDDLCTEWELFADGLRGHIDLYIKSAKAVVDWKTTTKKSLGYFPSDKQRMQVQLYGWLLVANGYPVDTVSLVAIARDGDESDVAVHTEPYDPELAQQGIDWLRDVEQRTSRPEPEKDAVSWCSKYCGFYGGACEGRLITKGAALPTIEDPEAAQIAAEYVEIDSQVKALSDRKDALRDALRGFSGVTTSNVTIAWSEIAGRQTVDEAAVMSALGYVPKKQGAPSQRLAVKQA